MIVTVTMNPSVDISYPLGKLVINDVNRVENVSKTAGGKGLNVSRVAKQLGSNVLATGIIGGTLGEFIQEQLDKQEIRHDFYQTTKESRNCIAILHEGNQTEILEDGPILSDQEETDFLLHFSGMLMDDQISVISISGSLPRGLSQDCYVKMIELANEKNILVILDTSGEPFRRVLETTNIRPTVIKPNISELSALEDKALDGDWNALKAVLEGQRYRDIEWIIVSMGSEGAFAKHHDKYYHVEVPGITAISPVGSGDATVAGIATALEARSTDEDLLKMAMTTGVLNTLEERTGYINCENYDFYYEKIKITQI
ncbi:tagatose-6-phosphate kinase [uncultured Trichococcus sp.]|uniref:tagatose-6-phosphate kinase n=1 Tax=uncultured Trichococcus sp. TaxID=189665 RepID=UPI0029C8865B|nr:tagatose-6-phosphate kinase [uncultured Trichococcus sp.]